MPGGSPRAAEDAAVEDVRTDLAAVPVSQPPVEKFREFLELRKLKVTSERLALVADVFEKHEHFDADELVARLRTKKLNVSRSTVYRTLTLLVEARMLRELRFGDRTVYEHDYGYPHHEHLYCEECGTVLEFVSEELLRLKDEVCRQFQFRPSHHKFVIHGVCGKCTEARSRRRRLDLI